MEHRISEPINPCAKDCPDRNGLCHSLCDKYKKYHKDYQVYKDARDKYLHEQDERSLAVIRYTRHPEPIKRSRRRR